MTNGLRTSVISSTILVVSACVVGYYYGVIRDLVPPEGLLATPPLWLTWGTFSMILWSFFLSYITPPICPLTWWLVHLCTSDRKNVPSRLQATFLLPPALVSLSVPLWGIYRYHNVPEYQCLPWQSDLLAVAAQVSLLTIVSSGLLIYTSESWRQFRKYGLATLGLIAVNTLTTVCTVQLSGH